MGTTTNSSTTLQIGNVNQAGVTQMGSASSPITINSSTIGQGGMTGPASLNLGSVVQFGNTNGSFVGQIGTMNQAGVGQVGNVNQSQIIQQSP
jgi:hypothetical protein